MADGEGFVRMCSPHVRREPRAFALVLANYRVNPATVGCSVQPDAIRHE